jgi:predicted RNA-binding protein with PIN domain
MPYLIDGHNLIPKVPGLSLDAIDDEIELIKLLQEFCQQTGRDVSVYFDNAPPGQPTRQAYGRVTAYFIRQERTADEAITARLNGMGRSARNWTVVSSDRAVQHNAKSFGARTISAEEFSLRLAQTGSTAGEQEPADFEISKEEVEHWLSEFGAPDEHS